MLDQGSRAVPSGLMTMQVSFNGRRDAAGPDGRGAASPTLTNPDMILPDYDDSESLDDDDDDDDDDDPLSPPALWQHDAQSPCNDFGSFSRVGFGSVPLGPTTPIIYGNGTMLSDIGEVTEVESTVGTQSRQAMSRLSGLGGDDTPLGSSPTMGNKVFKKRSTQHAARERRFSSDSNSTINDHERAAAAFDDFDDSVSVDDSNFQGDDEESMASSYVDDSTALSPRLAARSAQGLSLNEDRFSTSSISKRAEQILANAKRRLTTMEGNLNRARTFSYSSVSDGSTPSPVGRPATSLREHVPLSSSHARNASETGFLQATARPTVQLQRSASALGAAGGYRQPVQSRSAEPLGGRYSHSSAKLSHHPLDTTLAPLSEDGDDAVEVERTPPSYQHNSIASPTFGVYPEVALTRSASVAQVRDLQDQMQGLKGKISTLKEQARADSMKRRSLQSLRTPSPFTHATWSQSYSERQEVSSPVQGSPGPVTPWNGVVPGSEANDDGKPVERGIEVVPEEDEQSTVDGYHEAREAQDDEEPHVTGIEAEQDAGTHYEGFDGAYHSPGVDGEVLAEDAATQGVEDGANIEGVEDNADSSRDDVSESGESLYHDTVQHAISHEDREDAFDYEHFFLHSAMGTISRQEATRDYDYESEGSDDSAQTTRGPTTGVARRASLDTFVTVDSFATAAEGRESRNSATTAGDTRVEDGFVTPTEHLEDATTARRATLEGTSGSGSGGSSGDEASRYRDDRPRANSVLHRPASLTFKAALHRPSVSSFESTGTNRSFPLVNRTRLSGGILTPGASPEYDLKQVAESLMSETTSVYDREGTNGGGPNSPAIQMLSREDQLLVEHVVASLGKCVLGLTESSRMNPSGLEKFRHRIEAAKRVLEGGE
ncbi:hypothetical protein JDV02_001310 [Purpureocillium takamizusanense]|uniref:Uncharacterized protein n=1 Tax=Purpureocillium takamizusanense TaxID=2060973 RepID=A0A9Q8Q6H8_9HYPO|nr:uncharacterized protein JDV02_001310 [Purpureocillium takamizusanense]UNI14709.1 hypothetical protein JDV02_001310 [Purpureocillium takamizusanense]